MNINIIGCNSVVICGFKKTTQKRQFLRSVGNAIVFVIFAMSLTHVAHAGIIITTNQQSGVGTLPVSNVDLINSGQSTLSATSFVDTSTGNPVTALFGSSFTTLNNGLTSNALTIGNYAVGPTSWSAIFDLNLSANTFGYNITSISSFASWNDNRVNQKYDVYYSVVGSASYTYLTSVSYGPGAPSTPQSTSIVISDSAAGFIASNVDSIRFDFAQHPTSSETAFAEVDVAGIAAVPEPSLWEMAAIGLTIVTIFRRRKMA